MEVLDKREIVSELSEIDVTNIKNGESISGAFSEIEIKAEQYDYITLKEGVYVDEIGRDEEGDLYISTAYDGEEYKAYLEEWNDTEINWAVDELFSNINYALDADDLREIVSNGLYTGIEEGEEEIDIDLSTAYDDEYDIDWDSFLQDNLEELVEEYEGYELDDYDFTFDNGITVKLNNRK